MTEVIHVIVLALGQALDPGLVAALDGTGATVSTRDTLDALEQDAPSDPDPVNLNQLYLLDARLRSLAEAVELCERVRALPAGDVRGLLVAVDDGDTERRQAVLAAGADDLVTAPFTDPALAERLAIVGRLVKLRLERRRLSDSLQDEASRFRAFFDDAANGIAVVGLDGRTMRSNRTLQEMLGYPAAELDGRHASEVTHPDDVELDSHLRTELVEGKRERYAIEQRYLRRDGSTLWGHLSVSVVRDDQGCVRFAVGMVEDVTARKEVEAARNQLAAIVESSNDAIVGHTLDGTITSWNTGAMQTYGYTAAEAIGERISMLIAVPADAEVSEGDHPGRIDHAQSEHITKDGRRIPVFLTFSAIRGTEGEIVGASMIARDISERRDVERELFDTNETLRRRVEELQQRTREITLLYELGDLLQACRTAEEAYKVIGQVGAQIFPEEGGALLVRREAHNLLEVVASWGMGADYEAFHTPDDCWALRRGRTHHVADTRNGLSCHHLQEPPPGSYVCIPITAQGETFGLFYISNAEPDGVTETKLRLCGTVAEQNALALSNLRMQETLRIQSIRDPLTNLYNRRYMEESLDREIRRAARSERPLSVIMADLDHFKHFNDSFGHEAGDTLLRELGRILTEHIRGGDIACRYGGEEFILIMPEMELDEARARAEQIRLATARMNVVYRGRSLGRATISLGVAGYPHQGTSAHAILRAADAALYRAKGAGRDAVVVAE